MILILVFVGLFFLLKNKGIDEKIGNKVKDELEIPNKIANEESIANEKTEEQLLEEKVNQKINELSLKEKIGQMLVISYWDLGYNDRLEKFYKKLSREDLFYLKKILVVIVRR